MSGDQGVFALSAVLLTNLVLIWQFVMAAYYWNRSVTDDPE